MFEEVIQQSSLITIIAPEINPNKHIVDMIE